MLLWYCVLALASVWRLRTWSMTAGLSSGSETLRPVVASFCNVLCWLSNWLIWLRKLLVKEVVDTSHRFYAVSINSVFMATTVCII